MAVKPIPDEFHTVTPYLYVRGGADALAFYTKAFGAVERFRIASPDGKIGHAEIKIGNSIIMLADEFPQMGAKSPVTLGGTTSSILLYVEEVDKAVQRAINAGASVVRPLQDQFYGDRSATLSDPFGHVWTIATHVEDVPEEEIARRAQEAMKKH